MTSAEPLTAVHHWTHHAAVPAADDHSVLDRWDRVVALHGDAPALTGDGRAFTFAEADRASRGLATVLAEVLRPDDHSGAGVESVAGGASKPIGIMAGQTTEAVVGILALARAGRTVVVLDDHLPPARLAHVAQLAGVDEIVADADRAVAAEDVVADRDGRVHALEELLERAEHAADATSAADHAADATSAAEHAADAHEPSGHTAPRPGGRDPLVLVFTSGSTGMPKGVAMTHRQQLQNAEQDAVALGTGPADRLAVVLPLSFAAGFLFAFDTLLCGGTVVLLDPRDLGVERLLGRLRTDDVNTLVCTPHLLRSIVGAQTAPGAQPTTPAARPVLGGLRYLMTVGEPVTGTDVAAARPHLDDTTVLFNGFGSSEMGCVAYCPVLPTEPVPEGVVPAGYPLPGKSVRVVLEDGSPAGPGETGELVVVSDGMTAGYWGAPEKTAEHAGTTDGADGTTDDEQGTAPGTPTWRQGDLARLDPDGRLVLLGRSDDAVKVRGYLVEPSEVEAALRANPEVHDAVVTAQVDPPAVTRLVAYVVGRPGHRTPAPAAIRRDLRERLPEYMVPASIVPMTELPRNERGKVDRAELPGAPSVETEMVEGEYDQWELVVGQIWGEVLGLRGVHLDEDFSALGGDSLSAEEMLAIVHDRLGVDLRSSEVLEHPTLRAFARRVRNGTSALPSHPDVVKVSEARESGRPPVFCFAGGGALALTFLPLSRYLPEHDVYAFQQHALERRGLPDWNIERSARRYLALMRIVQPRGPYLLVGHSLGGLVALEVARLLTESGEQVEHVVLLDTYLPRTKSELARLHFGRMAPREQSKTVVRTLQRGVDRAVRRVLPAGVPYGDLFVKRLRAYSAGVLRHGGQKDFDAFFDQAEIVTRRHAPTPFHGRATYVLADANPDAEGWSALLRGPTETVRIAAEHTSLLREPHVADLATSLRTAFATEAAARD
ncbi:alpha/beta fold hydrolase [Curtobacterium sp. PhB115]|uniref:alpha/beta fold hydrolase n=1 Tax=Curtobacterium sp. PhB115 TaxID=2485173 RepID=UPI000FB9A3DB|nr:alpha/beta fold hydrolase [Curtobacterium sp. PhB115]ROP60482.1 acyl-CoA synthetase (AMP-forming)/AMP-acid ligase II [Curtobacterium sp. PhB115]